MNNENLLKASDLTSEQLRERARKGARASAEARKKKKTFKDALILLSQGHIEDDALKRNLIKMGMTEQEASEASVEMAVAFSLVSKAIRGDVKAINTYLDRIGANEDKAFEREMKRQEMEIRKAELEIKRAELERKTAPVQDDRVVIVDDIREEQGDN